MKKRNFLKSLAAFILIPFTPKIAKSFTGDALDHELSALEKGAQAQKEFNIRQARFEELKALPTEYYTHIVADDGSFKRGDYIYPKQNKLYQCKVISDQGSLDVEKKKYVYMVKFMPVSFDHQTIVTRDTEWIKLWAATGDVTAMRGSFKAY